MIGPMKKASLVLRGLAVGALSLLLTAVVGAQQTIAFGMQQVITTSADGAQDVHATDLDGDGDVDVLSASSGDNKIAWYENLGGGNFGPQQVITTSAVGALDVHATDLDSDGDVDVLSASSSDNKIAWYENLGGGNFGPQQVMSVVGLTVGFVNSVHAADLDGDGDEDVLSALYYAGVVWYENLGGGNFAAPQVLTNSGRYRSVYVIDLDLDGDADVLTGTFDSGSYDSYVFWIENLGGGEFGPPQKFCGNSSGGTNPMGLLSVHAADLDGDGFPDALSASFFDDTIAFHTNVIDLRAPAFVRRSAIGSSSHPTHRSVTTADLDADGDKDVVAGTSNSVVFYENLGGGSFATQQVLYAGSTQSYFSVDAVDLDGD
ncbi:MAG: hypothetical protein ACI9SE_000879, partial [Neolewinella sp.]